MSDEKTLPQPGDDVTIDASIPVAPVETGGGDDRGPVEPVADDQPDIDARKGGSSRAAPDVHPVVLLAPLRFGGRTREIGEEVTLPGWLADAEIRRGRAEAAPVNRAEPSPGPASVKPAVKAGGKAKDK